MSPDLSKKVGPFPLGVWIILGIVGVGLGYYMTRGSGVEPDLGGDGNQDGDPANVVGDGSVGGWDVNQPWLPHTETSTSGGGLTLAEWERKALRAVVRTKTDPLLAQSALHRYVTKKEVNDKQIEVIKQAIHLVGPPPVFLPIHRKTGTAGGGGGTPPPPNPHPTPGHGEWYQIKKGDSLSEITHRYFRADTGQHERDIFNANKKGVNRPGPTQGFMDSPRDLPPGRWLWIPEAQKHPSTV